MCYKCGTDDETYNPETDSCNSCMPNLKPHKHAPIIKAWADGEPIQVLVSGEWTDVTTPQPTWTNNYYRIKPNTIKYRLYFNTNKEISIINANTQPLVRHDFVEWLGDWQEVEV